jgi:tryptophan-rich sensory protein
MNNTSSNQKTKLKWWQMALISVAISILGGLSGGNISSRKQRRYYKELKQAPWAPPGWVFGPAWMVNNFFLLMGLKRLLTDKSIKGKGKILLVQAAIWTIFFTFNHVYFRKKSPILAAIWTNVDMVLALAGFILTFKKDKLASLSYLPLLGWTGFASSVADYQALTNSDQYLKTKALLN